MKQISYREFQRRIAAMASIHELRLIRSDKQLRGYQSHSIGRSITFMHPYKFGQEIGRLHHMPGYKYWVRETSNSPYPPVLVEIPNPNVYGQPNPIYREYCTAYPWNE